MNGRCPRSGTFSSPPSGGASTQGETVPAFGGPGQCRKWRDPRVGSWTGAAYEEASCWGAGRAEHAVPWCLKTAVTRVPRLSQHKGSCAASEHDTWSGRRSLGAQRIVERHSPRTYPGIRWQQHRCAAKWLPANPAKTNEHDGCKGKCVETHTSYRSIARMSTLS